MIVYADSPEQAEVRSAKKQTFPARDSVNDTLNCEGFLSGWKNGCLFRILYFEIEDFYIFSRLFGRELEEVLLAEFENAVELEVATLGDHDWFQVSSLEPGKVVALRILDTKAKDFECKDDSFAVCHAVRRSLRALALKLTGQTLNVVTGNAEFHGTPDDVPGSVMACAVRDAQGVAKGVLDGRKLGRLRLFREIIERQRLRPVYQPIVRLDSGGIHAWEALARGPEKSVFHTPGRAFRFCGGGWGSLHFGAVLSHERDQVLRTHEAESEAVSQCSPQNAR